MPIYVTKNFGKLRDLVKIETSVLQGIGDWAIETIRARTEQGLDVQGVPFQPLSAGYAKAKADAGLSPTADLTVSGRMLSEMRAAVSQPGVVEIRFLGHGGGTTRGTFIQRSRSLGGADKAFFHHVAGAGTSRVTRKFFDLSDAEVPRIKAKVLAHLDKVL